MQCCASILLWGQLVLASSFCILCTLFTCSFLQPCAGQLMIKEVKVLMSVRESLIDPQNETAAWDGSYTDPCTWHHVTCSADKTAVIRLELGRLHLSGTISSEISKLHSLQILSLEDNNITGAIPPELGSLSSLNTIDLSNNHLSGDIPSTFGQLKSLNSLRLNNNSLSGSIPAILASIEALSSVNFSFNNFSGQMPHFLAASQSVEGNPYLCGPGTGYECPGQEHSLPMNASQGFKSQSPYVNGTVLMISLVVVLGLMLPVALCLSLWIWRRRKQRQLYSIWDAEQHDIGTEFSLGQLKWYSLQELHQATEGFNVNNLLGTGGSGQVFKGCLQDGTMVAVKRLKDRTAVPQFKVELEMISLAAHRNLLRLMGCCTTSTELALVYPYMQKPPLDWATRKKVALGSARGLVYLHEQCDPKIIHGDVKAANILLDDADEAIVADFGLAKFLDHSVSHVTTAVRGTIGYIAPESLSGQISAKTDVYSYGILLLELVAGQTEIGFRGQKLVDWVKKLLEEKRLHELVSEDDRKKGFEAEELERMVKVALLSTSLPYAERPKMSEVLQMLEGEGVEERWKKSEEIRSLAAEQGGTQGDSSPVENHSANLGQNHSAVLEDDTDGPAIVIPVSELENCLKQFNQLLTWRKKTIFTLLEEEMLIDLSKVIGLPLQGAELEDVFDPLDNAATSSQNNLNVDDAQKEAQKEFNPTDGQVSTSSKEIGERVPVNSNDVPSGASSASSSDAHCPEPEKSATPKAKQPELVPARAITRSFGVVIEELPVEEPAPSKLNPKAKEWE
ncbi:hypothetical protein L7F22_035601 [Adiantum nelumboides]|nr:hypothetical protein [Adiantum nelumboides]